MLYENKFVADNVIIHSLLGEMKGSDNLSQVIEVWLKAFPDLQVTTEVHENDLVSVQWKGKGTHLGEFKGKQPSGKQSLYRCKCLPPER